MGIEKANAEVAQSFYQAYFLPLLHDVFFVLTDTSHKSGFSLQATILMKMFNLVETGQVRVPLGDAANNPGVSNQMFLRDHVMNLLVNAFPNVSKEHVRTFVVG